MSIDKGSPRQKPATAAQTRSDPRGKRADVAPSTAPGQRRGGAADRKARSAQLEEDEPLADELLEDDELLEPGADDSEVAEEADERARDRAERRYALRARFRSMVRNSSAFMISTIVHLVVLIVLGIFVIDDQTRQEVQTLVASVFEETPEDELVEVELEQDLEAVTEQTFAVFSAAPITGSEGAGAQGAATGEASASMQLDQKVVDQFNTSTQISIGEPMVGMPTAREAIKALPEGALGQERAVVDSYQEAMDRITQEIVWMLEKNDVLAIWCFDQSESMKDDQKEIRERVNKVYQELGLLSSASGDHLLTAITSYGENFMVHTRKPTSDRDEIRAAIDSVPIDPSGKEMMCEAVLRSVAGYRDFAKGSRRKMALILVSDESGERDNNDQYLERAIAEAKAAQCRLYVLGRESVFGYPYAHMRWQHPQTRRIHWLRIDRGPETGFVEQLQTDGFHRRYDAFGSGFGPFEQARMARETNGIFFMLPSVESNLVRGDKRRYELEAMRAYRPDLRARLDVMADRDRYPLRTLLWKVISDLNPYNPQSAQVIELRVEFSIDPAAFLAQARREQEKAIIYLRYLAEAEKALAEAARLRQQEANPRWQGNYDLIFAQIVAYQARVYEYGASLEAFIQNPKVVPLTKSPNLRLVNWDITTRKQTLTGDIAQPYIDRATDMFNEVIRNHPGTPWAARADWELKRGFGVDVVPDYEPPYVEVSNPIPVPKL
ncbi:MAG: VWA domain-containing protein [Pirellulaceae bacterium]|nr:VWA domain-containing protein [Pirellulaceae bacterium]